MTIRQIDSNSDNRVNKELVFYDDYYTKREAKLIEALELTHLERPRKIWETPRHVHIIYSKIPDEHKQAKQRRRENAKRRYSKQDNKFSNRQQGRGQGRSASNRR